MDGAHMPKPHMLTTTSERIRGLESSPYSPCNLRTFMVYKPELDFKLARRRSALSQADCAHLLATDQPRISKFERGKAQPSMEESALLRVLFGHELDQRSLEIIASQRDELLTRLKTIPDCPSSWRDPKTRFQTLATFAELLADLDVELYG